MRSPARQAWEAQAGPKVRSLLRDTGMVRLAELPRARVEAYLPPGEVEAAPLEVRVFTYRLEHLFHDWRRVASQVVVVEGGPREVVETWR